MNAIWIVVILALVISGAGFPILDVGIAVFAIVYGVRALSGLVSDNDQKPRKKKRLKIVEED